MLLQRTDLKHYRAIKPSSFCSQRIFIFSLSELILFQLMTKRGEGKGENSSCLYVSNHFFVKYHSYNRSVSCKFEESYFSLRIRKEKKYIRQLRCVVVGKTVILISGNNSFLRKTPLKQGKRSTPRKRVSPQNLRNRDKAGIISLAKNLSPEGFPYLFKSTSQFVLFL